MQQATSKKVPSHLGGSAYAKLPRTVVKDPGRAKLFPLPACLMPFPSHQGAGAFSPLNGSS